MLEGQVHRCSYWLPLGTLLRTTGKVSTERCCCATGIANPWMHTESLTNLPAEQQLSDKEPASHSAFCLSPAPLYTLWLRWSLWNNSLQPDNSSFINALSHSRRVHRKDCPEHNFLQNDFPLLKYLNSFSSSTLFWGKWNSSHKMDIEVYNFQVHIAQHKSSKGGYDLTDDSYMCSRP